MFYVLQCIRLCLLEEVRKVLINVFLRDNHTRHLPRRNQEPILFNEDCCCVQMLLASMNKKKVTSQAWIQVCNARNHPNAIPKLILICTLCLY